MKIWRHFPKAPIRVSKITRRRSKSRLRRALVQIKLALAQERHETKHMLFTYKEYTRGRASSEEMKIAHQQFGDILKGLGLGVFAVLPFAPITIPVVIKLGKWVGVDILPSAFTSTQELPTIKKDQTESTTTTNNKDTEKKD